MVTVITYGTYDLLHRGHINLLRNARALGDRLIVGVTTEGFDKVRGKLLVRQSLNERVEAVKATGLADEVIIEEYEGQKIDDIRRYGVDVFAIGDDWAGRFDYLSEFCKVVYLPRTRGISSTELRSGGHDLRLGVVGDGTSLDRLLEECGHVGGLRVTMCLDADRGPSGTAGRGGESPVEEAADLDELLPAVDAVYAVVSPRKRSLVAKKALEHGVHVLCETPVALDAGDAAELLDLARDRGLVFAEALKTAYSLAFQRMKLLLKGGVIGEVKSVEATCTSLHVRPSWSGDRREGAGAMTDWGPYVLLPALDILGHDPVDLSFIASFDEASHVDQYTKIIMRYPRAEATLKAGGGVKAEGDLVVAGTRGYVYAPAPWWKMDYFEIRKEDPRDNRRYFYQFEGDGIRDELADFVRRIRNEARESIVTEELTRKIAEIIEIFRGGAGVHTI